MQSSLIVYAIGKYLLHEFHLYCNINFEKSNLLERILYFKLKTVLFYCNLTNAVHITKKLFKSLELFHFLLVKLDVAVLNKLALLDCE